MCIYCPPPHVHTTKSFLIRLHLLSPTQLPIPILHEYILTLAAEHCDGKRRHRFSRRISIHPTESGAGVGARRALQQAKHKGTADQDPGAISRFPFLIPLSFSLYLTHSQSIWICASLPHHLPNIFLLGWQTDT
jgi:hypothetical protein